VEGLPNRLIARRLLISEKTVKAHLTSIFRQLDVASSPDV
jgi:DNA-binding CsgD family transcriptional regulator